MARNSQMSGVMLASAPIGSTRRRRILVVEDDCISGKIVGYLLDGLGHDARLAETVDEATLEIARCPPDLIVLDLILPGTSGLVLAERLHEDPATTHIPIVAMSSFDDDRVWAVLDRYGIETYLRKPLDLDELAEAVTRILKESP